MLVHLALTEVLDRLLVRTADMHDELRANLDLAPIAARLVGFFLQHLHAGSHAVDMDAGRKPAVAPFHGTGDVVEVVAADIDRKSTRLNSSHRT